MEYTDYFVAKGTPEFVRKKIREYANEALIIDYQKDFVPFVVYENEKNFEKKWDWLLRVFDAEGSAWGFDLYVSGREIITATYGENMEWGIDLSDNGYKGNLEEAAKELDVKKSQLEKCLNDQGVEKFCKLVGFNHEYMLYPHEDEIPDGVYFLSELSENSE